MIRKKHTGRAEGPMVYGIHPVLEAIESGQEIDRILVNRKNTSEQVKKIKSLCRVRNIPMVEVPIEKLNRVTSKNHQDVICFISSVTYSPIEEIVQQTFQSGKTPLILVLDHLTDVRNFGAIARTASCSGVDAIVIPSKGSAQINAEAIKASAGALMHIPLCRVHDLNKITDYLKESGLTIVAATEKAEQLIMESELSTPVAIIMGNEETGISNSLIRKADSLCRIPMEGKLNSLNVSVATGILLYEVTRQRLMNDQSKKSK